METAIQFVILGLLTPVALGIHYSLVYPVLRKLGYA